MHTRPSAVPLTLLLLGMAAATTGPAPAAAAPAPSAAPQVRSVDPHAGETTAHRNARMAWWRKARFGMFIHWGLYAQASGSWKGRETNGAGEWIMHDLKIPVADYAAQAPEFNPVQFDADTWVSIAKAAGMKYIVMTAKHHEGFAMFHTTTDGYNIYDATPFKRDPIAEMAAACKRQGIKFGVYYSQAQDWHHPGGAAYGGHWDPAQDGDLDTYVRTIAAPQVRELLTRYHPAILWWDTSVTMSPEDIALLTSAFPVDPGLIANNRLGNGVSGDTETPEQYVPATGYPGKDWETCMTINDTWGFKTQDTDFKSSTTLLRNLIDIASKGGNYLLNVGPTRDGIIPIPEVQRIETMGAWLKVNGDGIYGTTASPYRRLPFDGRCTVKGKTLYLHVFSWPEGGLSLTGLQTPVLGASALATGQKLQWEKTADNTLLISRPAKIDPDATVVALRLAGPPVVSEIESAIAPKKDGRFSLKASDAATEGETIKLEGPGDTENLGYWINAADSAHWRLAVPAGGAYHASMVYSCEPGSEGSTFELQVDGIAAGVTGTVAVTEGWGDYHTLPLNGVLHLTPGPHVLRVAVLSKPRGAVMNLRQITLTPIGG